MGLMGEGSNFQPIGHRISATMQYKIIGCYLPYTQKAHCALWGKFGLALKSTTLTLNDHYATCVFLQTKTSIEIMIN